MKGTNVEITDSDGELLSFKLRKMNVSASARRYALYERISKVHGEKPQAVQNMMMVASNLISVLSSENGDLIYPPADSVDKDDSVEKLFDDMDEDVFTLLCTANAECNPVKSSLTAKKKPY